MTGTITRSFVVAEAKVAVRVLLVSDHAIEREGLRALLERVDEVSVVAQCDNEPEAVELVQRLRPDIALLDVSMPGLSCPGVIQSIVQGGCTRVLVLAARQLRHKILDALRAGAAGCVVKEAEPEELFTAIETVYRGQAYLSPCVAKQLIEGLVPGGEGDSPLNALTGREREVLQLIAEGLRSQEIAARVGVSIKTVNSHRAALMKKLDVHKVSALVRIAIREGLVQA
jgi:DNA-binding NarL/FixJ family response regulator